MWWESFERGHTAAQKKPDMDGFQEDRGTAERLRGKEVSSSVSIPDSYDKLFLKMVNFIMGKKVKRHFPKDLFGC